MRTSFLLLAMTAVPAFALFAGHDAAACGGFFGETDDAVTQHRMVLSIGQSQTTLYDEIAYTGAPSSFAWVLPIKGQVTIGLSADAVFDTFDALTATEVSPPQVTCPSAPSTCPEPPTENGAASGSSSGGGGVDVTNEQVVGPYETVQLQSTDPQALSAWLASNGYSIPSAMQPVVAAYVAQGFDFLAMKLIPGAGVQSMRPVRVSFAGASPTLPLRMVAGGTGPTVSITLWVVGDGRWEPANFPWFRIQDTQLIWNWSTNTSNYTTLEQQTEAAANNATWEVQASIEENLASVESQIQETAEYGIIADGSGPAPSTPGADNYLPVAASGSSPAETADQVMADDVTALFAGTSNGTFRLTRLRADLAHAALANDLELQAAADQSELTNFRVAAQSVNGPLCPVYDGCNVIGEAPYTPGTSGGSGGGCATVAAPTGWETTAGFVGALGLLMAGGLASRRRR
jgi:MYXO-CTERM domain-containing protein